jgi:hypothetical protein
MVEVLDQLKRAKEQAESLQRTSEALAGEGEGLLFVAHDACNFVRLLCVIWAIMQVRFRNGGVPAKRLLQECDLLLDLGDGIGERLVLIDKLWQEQRLPTESDMMARLYKDIQENRELLASLLQGVRQTRERAAVLPRISADPVELNQRCRQADEGEQWVKLADVVSRMRQSGSPKQE